MARNNQRLILEWLAPLNAIVRKGPHYFKPEREEARNRERLKRLGPRFTKP